MVNFFKSNGIWTLIVLLISAPIAFLVWKFRDENTIHQLENQRKDVNLKEFQKIAEWVSGLHLVEDKVTKKTKKIEKSAEPLESQETETSREYGQTGTSRHIPSHSRRQDGAVGLQVAAVYMLRPFYCGEHGDGFRKPALNLLTAAWLALFKQTEENTENQSSNQKLNPDELRKSPLAIALTEVLLADGGVHLRRYPEVFPNLYLPYLNLRLPGLDRQKVLMLFSGELDCSGINLKQVDLQKADLKGAELSNAELSFAKLSRAKLNNADLIRANLIGASLVGASLIEANLIEASLVGASLVSAELDKAYLHNAKLDGADLNRAKLNKAELDGASLIRADLNHAELKGTYLEKANLYQAKLSYIELDNDTVWKGTVLNIGNVQQISDYFNKDNITWIIQVLESNGISNKLFRFERDWFVCAHKLPDSLTVEVLEKLNPQWKISLIE